MRICKCKVGSGWLSGRNVDLKVDDEIRERVFCDVWDLEVFWFCNLSCGIYIDVVWLDFGIVLMVVVEVFEDVG